MTEEQFTKLKRETVDLILEQVGPRMDGPLVPAEIHHSVMDIVRVSVETALLYVRSKDLFR